MMSEDRRISRYEFLRAALALSAAPLLRFMPARAADDASSVMEIAPGVFVHQGRYEMQSPENRGDMANAAFVVGSEAVAVIDTLGSVVVARELRDAIRAATDKPIRYVINTHMHPDHTLGNAAFKEDKPDFVGHYKLPRALATRADRYLESNKRMLGEAAFAGIEIVMPTRTVQEGVIIELGRRDLLLEAQPTAHTDNDLIVTDGATKTLFLGDLLFSVHVPTLDGSITGWLGLIDTLKTREAARVVPGHGPHAMRLPAALDPEQRYLSTVATDVKRLIAEGKTLEDATETAGFSERNSWKLFDDYHVRNVSAAFSELEWQ
jgi:quinoprotein relay system zinc metallohydrolase 2